MLRKLMASLATVAVAFLAATGFAFAAVDVNTADQAQLESIKGIGPAISAKIIAERKKGNFKDWADLETRVPGVGDKNSAKFSESGLTVGGQAKGNAPAMSQSTATKTKSAMVPPSADVNSKQTMTTSKNTSTSSTTTTSPDANNKSTMTTSKNTSTSPAAATTMKTTANPKSDAMDTPKSTTTKSKKGSGETTSTDSTTTTTKK